MSSPPAETDELPALPIDVDRLTEAYERRYNWRDIPALADLYDTDARWLAAAGPVFEGRLAIAGALRQFQDLLPPRLSLIEQDRFVFGRLAVSRGSYALSASDDSTPRLAGAYLNVLQNDGSGWRIASQQMNYANPIPPELWVGDIEAIRGTTSRAKAPSITPVVEALFDERVPSSELLSSDVCAALPGWPWEIGCEAVADRLASLRRPRTRVVFHELDSWRLSQGQSAHTGWYELVEGGSTVTWGTVSIVARQQLEGPRRIRWLVATGSPTGAASTP